MLKIGLATIINESEILGLNDILHSQELFHSIKSIRYCKIEIYKDCILGTLRVPEKKR